MTNSKSVLKKFSKETCPILTHLFAYAPYDLARHISYPLWFTRILIRDERQRESGERLIYVGRRSSLQICASVAQAGRYKVAVKQVSKGVKEHLIVIRKTSWDEGVSEPRHQRISPVVRPLLSAKTTGNICQRRHRCIPGYIIW